MMYYRLSQLLLIIGCYFIHMTESLLIFDTTNTDKLLCYACKGAHCETIANEHDNVMLCNKHTQLCWAGFVDQQPYRTCASRYCTPSGISLDSDIRIETCCHGSLCNFVPLSWAIWSKWYKKPTTQRPETSTVVTTKVTTKQTTIPTTIATTTIAKRTPPTSRIYIVNEIVNNLRHLPNDKENSEERVDVLMASSQLNANDPAKFGINWARKPYYKGSSNRVVSMSKLLILLVSVFLLVLC